jgi:transposase
MHQALRLCCLVPPGFAVVSTVCEESRTVITVRSIAIVGVCPSCGAVSRRVHSGYRRRAADLPLARDTPSKADSVTIAAIETGVPRLVEAPEIIAKFHFMIRQKAASELAPWIAQACQSLVASFGNGVEKDVAAVRAAIVLPWSNGQTEGQITRLKLVKRQMYGRAKIDVLQVSLIGAD